MPPPLRLWIRPRELGSQCPPVTAPPCRLQRAWLRSAGEARDDGTHSTVTWSHDIDVGHPSRRCCVDCVREPHFVTSREPMCAAPVRPGGATNRSSLPNKARRRCDDLHR
jgi:hypothetical protein